MTTDSSERLKIKVDFRDLVEEFLIQTHNKHIICQSLNCLVSVSR